MLLAVSDLVTFYGKVNILKGVSLEVQESELVALIGPNGAGKSTLLKSVFGLVKSPSGCIKFRDIPIENHRPVEVVRLGISYVPQGRSVFPSLTVVENLEMGAYIRTDKQRIKEDIEAVFRMFPALRIGMKKPAGQLSGGQQQMLAMGRAMMLKPDLLLLDEPSLGLAPMLVEEVFNKIKEINDTGTSIILVEQNVAMALKLADRGYVLDSGEIVLQDSAQNLLDSDRVRKTYLAI